MIEQIKKADNYIKHKKLSEAENILDRLLKNIEPVEIDKYGKILDFANQLEFILYCNMDKHFKISWTRNFLSDVYLLKGIVQYDNKKYNDAIFYCEKALRWNPVSIEIYSEILEACMKMKDFEKFQIFFDRAIKVAIRPIDLSILYKKLAYVWIDKGNDEIAYNLLLYSKLFFPRKEIDIEIAYLENKVGTKLKYFPDLGAIQYLREKNLEYERPDYIVPTLINAIKLMTDVMKKDENLTKNTYLVTIDYYHSLYFHRPGSGIHAQMLSLQREYEHKYLTKKENT